MGLPKHCESCEDDTDTLFPVAVLVESVSGGEEMVIRYYCAVCFWDLLEDAAKDIDKKEEEEKKDE